jgi:hypothetical protein
MKNNPLSLLATPEQKKEFDKIRFYSLFYPFKQKRLDQVGNEVKKTLSEFNINYPIVFNFKNPREFSRYAIADTDSTKYMNYTLFIHYNPRFITLEFNQLIKTGLHEYCHFIYRQNADFSQEIFQQLFSNIDYCRFIESVNYLAKKFVVECTPQVPPDKREILKDPLFIEEIFVESFAGYLMGSKADIFVEEKKHFEIIVRSHIQIMRAIRHIHFGEE